LGGAVAAEAFRIANQEGLDREGILAGVALVAVAGRHRFRMGRNDHGDATVWPDLAGFVCRVLGGTCNLVISGVAHWIASTVVWDWAGPGPVIPNALL
tara:strand:+ start:281 stop:574 length:294 start_codon:yes stop_codon:yes gene_type:complete